MMDARAARHDELIDRYLNDQLSDGERTAFEITMMQDGQLFARVQLLDAFKTSLVEEGAALRVKHKAHAPAFRTWLQQPLSLVASVLVAGLGLQVINSAFTDAPAVRNGLGVGAVFVLEATRGGTAPVLSGAAPYLFQIDAGPGAAGAATVSLRDEAGTELLRIDELDVDASGWVRVVVDQPLSGAYTVELLRAGNSAGQRFDLRITD